MKAQMNVSQVLWKAAKIIEREGWCQRQNSIGDSVCVFRAIKDAAKFDSIDPAFTYFRDFLGTNPIVWNDMFRRTKEEVIDLLVIASIEAEQVKG